jgi:hypothetical protein
MQEKQRDYSAFKVIALEVERPQEYNFVVGDTVGTGTFLNSSA